MFVKIIYFLMLFLCLKYFFFMSEACFISKAQVLFMTADLKKSDVCFFWRRKNSCLLT